MITTLFLAILPWTAAPLSLHGEAPRSLAAGVVSPADLDDQFAALEGELEGAMETWWTACLAADEAGVQRPAYPGDTFQPRFEAIAQQGQLGAQVWMMNHTDWEDDAGRLMWLERVLMEHSEDEGLESVFRGLTWSFKAEDTAFFELLETYKEKTSLPSYKLAAQATRALIFCESGNGEQKEEGLALLKELDEVQIFFPGKNAVASAIFITENLQIGMVAPEFTAVDVDGAPISLSDYRGKVTILDFWGFW